MTSKVSMRCCCAREISRTGTLDVDVAMSMLGDVLDVDVNCDVGCAVPKFRSLKVAPVVHPHGHGHGNVRVAVDRDPTHNVERSYVEYSNVSELRSSRGAARRLYRIIQCRLSTSRHSSVRSHSGEYTYSTIIGAVRIRIVNTDR